MDLQKAVSNFEKRGFIVHVFENKEAAADYLAGSLEGKTIGFGGSVTLRQMDLLPRLREKNRVFWHHEALATGEMPLAEALKGARDAEVYITSANAASESGELVNMDGRGNRISNTLYGPKQVYFVLGENKFEPTLEQAIWRVRNVAAPKNAQRLNIKAPCAVGGRCYDCSSPDRFCTGMAILFGPMHDMERVEILIIKEELGY